MNTGMIYFDTGVILLGIFTSYTDLKYNLIKNKHLLYGIIYGTLVYLYLFITKGISVSLDKLIVNLIIAISISFSLYLSGLWSAGDTKLFIVYSFLLPKNKYSSIFMYSCLAIFINVAIISTAAAIILETVKMARKPIIYIKKIFTTGNIKIFLKSLLIIFSLTWIVSFAFKTASFVNPVVYFITLYLSYSLVYAMISKISKYKPILITLLAAGIIERYFLQPEAFLSINSLISYTFLTTKYTFICIILRMIFINEGEIVKEKAIAFNGQRKKTRISFAPFMLAGTLLTDSNLIMSIIKLLIKKH